MLEQNKLYLHNCDNMEFMKTIPDKYFQLACVDPPYGINYENGGEYFDNKYSKKKWDKDIPDENYFNELFRVSKNQIIWGGNYFYMPPCRCFINWYKTDELKDRTFSECEFAWTSFNEPSRQIELKPFQRNGTRIHPTQKPIALYKWLLSKYAKQGDKIFDSHLGSMSSVIAAYEMGFEIHGCELDKEYFDAGVKRVTNVLRQLKLF